MSGKDVWSQSQPTPKCLKKTRPTIIQLLPIYLQLLSYHKFPPPMTATSYYNGTLAKNLKYNVNFSENTRKSKANVKDSSLTGRTAKQACLESTHYSNANNNFQWAYFEH